jgi:hypothetical protein
MKKNMLKSEPRYIVDDSGKRREVIIDIKIYEKLMEQLEDYYLGIEAQKIKKSSKSEDYVDFKHIYKDILKK